ncbi:hypothetical protein GMOD_00004098 [Pyrenophora seminiperda CCB06]|uniref:Uncharacterized protein n=1 Tax=Pyrenophora seminiperda CCB06 TaxID=1302712 RepID=A0A3M7M0R0_9PLEO|nr:hypothetical protein GMOD_00004098 [Pyrenophora seminiperda CCB06]
MSTSFDLHLHMALFERQYKASSKHLPQHDRRIKPRERLLLAVKASRAAMRGNHPAGVSAPTCNGFLGILTALGSFAFCIKDSSPRLNPKYRTL